MPKVPAMMPYCEAIQDIEPNRGHCIRVTYRSMVLKPKEWVMDHEHNGLSPLNGDETKGEFTVETEEEETVKFSRCIEFSTNVIVSEDYGPVKVDSSLKLNASAAWEKTVKTTKKRVQTVEQGCSYQPTRIFAKLLCEVTRAKTGSFMVSGLDNDELITTNPCCAPVEDKHKASKCGFVKSIDELSGLYHAFGKYVVTRFDDQGSFWAKASSARLKLVVDPIDARLYVTGEACSVRSDGLFLFSSQSKDLADYLDKMFDVSWIKNTGPIIFHNAKLNDYRGLYGDDALCTEEKITYSPGSSVKIWKVAVKAIKS
ncbi:hypothetical protein BG011_008980 [Mortierella polycephala]|uniref:Uncharacterized protein n=1 Tax=Mortierella polycephala TaxID=41804 RepID=A0A9P6PN01_9FUNG|nr:hypothetical protein BG011_008980 [Mortierella polycephala]